VAFISIERLTKNFGSFRALNNIDIAIEEKEFVTFLGPSGCGKTTTLRIVAGFVAPDAGTISVDGRVLSSPGAVVPPEQRRMGMVFQNYAVWPHMSVLENVTFGLRYLKLDRAEAKRRVAQVLAAVGLEGLEGRHPGQLSGGQQQRVALARSLVVQPSILLLDEPLSNLDAKLRERMRTELKDLQRRTGITFIYVTHDQAEAMALSDRIVVFHRGTVQQVGTPREVYERPANLFVADFMGQVNRVPVSVLHQDGNRATVLAAGQEIAATGATAGSRAVLAIRPEAIRFASGGDAGTAADNHLAGTIAEATFLGNIVDYQVAVGDGVTLRVQGDRRGYREAGSAVTLLVPAADCALMSADADIQEIDAGPAAG
jgi:iron(III) transport system ATP-binding protein